MPKTVTWSALGSLEARLIGFQQVLAGLLGMVDGFDLGRGTVVEVAV